MKRTQPIGQSDPSLPLPMQSNVGATAGAGCDDPLALEWSVYQRELPRLIGEGREGQFILIKDGEIIGFFDTWKDARKCGLNRYKAAAFFVKKIVKSEPYLRIRGVNHPWGVKAIL